MGGLHDDAIDIGDKDKADVLAALYNSCAGCRRIMDRKEALAILERSKGRITYIDGLTLKISLTGDKLWPTLYDRANGEKAAEKALRKAGLL